MELQVCTRCLMDTTTSTIVFDDEGVCNYCKDLTIKLQKAKKIIENEILHRDMFIKKLKKDKGKLISIVGVGGVNSSYHLTLRSKRALDLSAVHLIMDELSFRHNIQIGQSSWSRSVYPCNRLGRESRSSTVDVQG